MTELPTYSRQISDSVAQTVRINAHYKNVNRDKTACHPKFTTPSPTF